MSRLLQNAYNYIKEHKMLLPDDRIVIGLSGGADSVCLLLVLNALKNRLGISEDGLVAVHINHLIRGDEAEADREFAEKLCDRLGIEFIAYSKDIPAYAREKSCSVEEAGRMYRYQCFEEAAALRKCSKIAVAHNKNDVAETVLFNLVRGTGIKGLGGIPAVRGRIIRPLLFATRMEIEEYLKECNESYRVDSTNNGTDYDRNKIRHIILPVMSEINASAVEHICQVAELAEESYTYVDRIVQERLEKLSQQFGDDGSLAISRAELLKESEPVRRQLIHEIIGRSCGHKKDITGRHIRAVEELLEQQTGKQLELPYGLRVRVSYDHLIFSRTEEAHNKYNMEIAG
ncbi:MAG: tRNA lysidine(34) synthetase TilS, partial [Wujia sp.]